MSLVFEAILLDQSPARVDAEVILYRSWTKVELLGSGTILFREAATERSETAGALREIAVELSSKFEKSLWVWYDSRTGERLSVFYRAGRPDSEFTASDELFFPLDDDGEPLTHSRKLMTTELDPEEEYETAVNAIELGLQHLPICSFADLQSFLA